jgi:hypothetical protein
MKDKAKPIYYEENINGNCISGYQCSICGKGNISKNDNVCPDCKTEIDWKNISQNI